MSQRDILDDLLGMDERRLVAFNRYHKRAVKLFNDIHDTLEEMGGNDYADVRQVTEDEHFTRAVDMITNRLDQAVDMLKHHCQQCGVSGCIYCAMDAPDTEDEP